MRQKNETWTCDDRLRSYHLVLLAALPLIACENGAEGGAELVINEIVASPEEGTDWVELFVIGTGSISVSSFSIVDDNPDHTPVSLPDLTLRAGVYYVIPATREPPLARGSRQR